MVTIGNAYDEGIDGVIIVRKCNGDSFSLHKTLKPAWTFLDSKQMYHLFALKKSIKIEDKVFIRNFIETR